ncbi:hypothetical protein ACSVDA_18810 [Cytobacillus sp. Hm23]
MKKILLVTVLISTLFGFTSDNDAHKETKYSYSIEVPSDDDDLPNQH